MNIKQKLYNKCREFIGHRLDTVHDTIKDIQNALQSETKSSAGDKHETGRAMLQLEREKAGQQLAELQKLSETLQKIDVESKHQKVALGSVVKTSNQNYFISISTGEVTIDDELFYCVSAATPIGKLLLSKEIGNKIKFRNKEFVIRAVF